ncbi:MAG: RNA polymerase subunit sigma-70 [Acidobacteria bacterium]|nr:RNA polymerase subunit sigma-70 [Acidobacteriota bacterium]
MTEHAAGEVTRLLDDLNAGDEEALPLLLPLVYDELRRIAARRLHHEPSGHPLQATALVHEAYLRLVGQHEVRWKNRSHFFAVAAQAMRRVLVDHARARLAGKRGGVQARVPLDDVVVASEPPPGDLVALDEALDRLARHDPHQARLVELRFFAGLTVEETADVLGISDTTVKREWRMARAWLHREMSRTAG